MRSAGGVGPPGEASSCVRPRNGKAPQGDLQESWSGCSAVERWEMSRVGCRQRPGNEEPWNSCFPLKLWDSLLPPFIYFYCVLSPQLGIGEHSLLSGNSLFNERY